MFKGKLRLPFFYAMNLDQEILNTSAAIVGCDEVGRGPLAGPVVACSVRFYGDEKRLKQLSNLDITDSKKLSSKKRKKILSDLNISFEKLKTNRVFQNKDFDFSFCLADAAPDKIDEINIFQASLLAMKDSSERLVKINDYILVDGKFVFETDHKNIMPVIKGDSKSMVIALASIIAKEFRDEKMIELSLLHPVYMWHKNSGYPTKDHLQAIKDYGITNYHRKSFKGVKEFVQ